MQRKPRPAIVVDDRKPDIEYEPTQFFGPCFRCGRAVLLAEPYEPEMCCSGHECGCYGMPTNPVFCPECVDVVFCGEDYWPETDEEDQPVSMCNKHCWFDKGPCPFCEEQEEP
jgi:hypothetical protein